jgi:Pyridoxamine 5'-phosphate oxidase
VDLSSFIETHRRAFLVTRTAAGGPTAHPMTLIPHDGTMYFNTYRKSAKARNLARDPRLACVVTSPELDAWVTVKGRAEEVAAEELPASMLGGGGAEGIITHADLARVRERVASGKRVYLRVVLTSVMPGGAIPPAPRAVAGLPVAWEPALRPSPIAMTAPEVDAFLRAHGVAAFASIGPDGWPEACLAPYVGGAGDLVVGAALAADGQVCLTVDEFPTYDTIRGVMVHGTGHPAGGSARVDAERVVSFDFSRARGSGTGR